MGATYRWQLGLDFLPSPHGLIWASHLPTPASHPCLPHAPCLEGRGPRGPWPLSPDCRGQREAQGTWLCGEDMFSESCPTRAGAATNCKGSCPSLGVFKQGLEAAGSSWGGPSDHQESF